MEKQTPNNIIEQRITETLETNYMPYTMSVIVSRAIPEIDGFKPAHRKLLYTMFKMSLLTGGRVKSADVVGQTMRLNPHGDLAIYDTLVRLTRGNDSLLHPFVDSKGNFGKQYSRDMACAASRYTEVKLDAICAEIFRDIDKETVDFMDNYNGTMKEPMLLPTTFPNVLVTCNQGIAVGMASSVCGFNLAEVCRTTINYIKDRNADLTKTLPAPDFSTGGQLIYNEKEIESIYETGRGGVKLRAKYRFDKKNSCIEIFEIPYSTTIEAIIDKIIALVKANKLRDINDVRDETDLGGLKITLDIKRGADPDIIMHKLFSMTTLSDTFSCNFNILIDGRPRTMGIREILGEWLRFRVGCIRRRIAYDIARKSEKLHLLEGLSKILLDIDKAIKIIRETENEQLVIPNLMKGFGISQTQAEFIAEIKLRNLNKEYLLNRINEISELQAELAELDAISKSDARIEEIICGELRDIVKKYGKPRRTEIIYKDDAPDISQETLIENYPVRLLLTEHNYFKKINIASLRSEPEQYMKDDDTVMVSFEAENKADVLFFSSGCNVYKAKLYELPECKASGLGEFLPNFLGLDENERIIFMTTTIDYGGWLFVAYENGKAAKVTMTAYATKMNRKKLVNALSDKSKPVFLDYIRDDCDYVAITNINKALLFNTALIASVSSKSSGGVQVFTLRKNTVLAEVKPAEAFNGDANYFRVGKIPSSGHFILKDKG